MAAKLVFSIASMLALVCSAASAQTVPPTVSGIPATIYVASNGTVVGGPLNGMPYFGVLIGTSGDDVMVGTGGRDVILGLGGNDLVTALGGNDFIEASAGNDIIDGAAGFDFGIGGSGFDTCTAETEISISCELRAPLAPAPTVPEETPAVTTPTTSGGLFASLPFFPFNL